MRPLDPANGEPAGQSLFELMMGMTPGEWDRLGTSEQPGLTEFPEQPIKP